MGHGVVCGRLCRQPGGLKFAPRLPAGTRGEHGLHHADTQKCPKGASDGGYAVSNFRNIDDVSAPWMSCVNSAQCDATRNILLTLDVVVNHTSDEHDGHNRRARATALPGLLLHL